MFSISKNASYEILRQDSNRGQWLNLFVDFATRWCYVSWIEPVELMSNSDHVVEEKESGVKIFVGHSSYVLVDGLTIDFNIYRGFFFRS
jgi:Fe-S cluster assembly iron-binding protein IscA